MPLGHKPAGPEILAEMYAGMTQPSVKGWLVTNFEGAKSGVLFTDLYAMADTCDSIIEDIRARMPDPNNGAAFARHVAQSRALELNLRHLAAQKAFDATRDPVHAARIRLSRPPGGDPTPQWLTDAARVHSTAVFKEQARNKPSKGAGRGKGDAGGGSSQDAPKGRGRGGRGRGRGAPPATAKG